jgi:hypothetical protein
MPGRVDHPQAGVSNLRQLAVDESVPHPQHPRTGPTFEQRGNAFGVVGMAVRKEYCRQRRADERFGN